MTFWLPETEAARAQVDSVIIMGSVSVLIVLPYAQERRTIHHTSPLLCTSFRTLLSPML